MDIWLDLSSATPLPPVQTSGLWKRCFWKTVFCPLPKIGVLTKNGKNDVLPTKTRGCAPHSPETDENDENGGCPSDKTTVCQKRRLKQDAQLRAAGTLSTAENLHMQIRKKSGNSPGTLSKQTLELLASVRLQVPNS